MSEIPDGPDTGSEETHKWRAFTAIAISFVVMVFSMTMVFVSMDAIAEDFGVTLRAVSWVVIVQSLVISALMLPMGRVADIVGRRNVHLVGLVLFFFGSLFVALAPTFETMIAARVVMAVGNAMGQAVGTAMIVSVFPSHERGKALGSQTSVVAIGAAMGPIIGGFVLQAFPWETLFLMLLPPVAVSFVAGYLFLDASVEDRSERQVADTSAGFDWGGALLSALAITGLVLVASNPMAWGWTSPPTLAGLAAVVAVAVAFVRWELRRPVPMLQLRLFTNPTFAMAVTSRTLGFVGYTAVSFLMPIFLISVRGLREGATGGVLFLTSLGMGLAANQAGRSADRLGEAPLFLAGFSIHVLAIAGLGFVTADSPMWLVMVLLFGSGLALGLWNVPNGSAILGSVPSHHLGVVGAFMNLTRNLGNVVGQALATAVVVGIMASDGYDIPLSEIAGDPGAIAAFVRGGRMAYLVVTVLSIVALGLAWKTRPSSAAAEPAAAPALPAPEVVTVGSGIEGAIPNQRAR
ncbi:MAG: MFS transporter [Acidimicrobiales bacterium]